MVISNRIDRNSFLYFGNRKVHNWNWKVNEGTKVAIVVVLDIVEVAINVGTKSKVRLGVGLVLKGNVFDMWFNVYVNGIILVWRVLEMNILGTVNTGNNYQMHLEIG